MREKEVKDNSIRSTAIRMDDLPPFTAFVVESTHEVLPFQPWMTHCSEAKVDDDNMQ